MELQADSTVIAPQKPTPRRRVKARSPRYDGRSIEAVRVRRLAAGFRAALGDAATDPIVKVAITRAAELVTIAEALRGKAIRGDVVDLAELLKLEGVADRAVRGLGIKPPTDRGPRPTLAQYLAARDAGDDDGK